MEIYLTKCLHEKRVKLHVYMHNNKWSSPVLPVMESKGFVIRKYENHRQSLNILQI